MEFWDIEHIGKVVVAGYRNPPSNYMVADATTELSQLVAAWRDSDVKAIVLTGAVRDRYITHYSVEELVEMGQDESSLRAAISESTCICGASLYVNGTHQKEASGGLYVVTHKNK